MEFCGTPIKTRLGKLKGTCFRPLNHVGGHGNNLCWMCCVVEYEHKQSGLCAACRRKRDIRDSRKQGAKPLNIQVPEKLHTFSCGCVGILPKKGEQNKFAMWVQKAGFRCRAQVILLSSKQSAKKNGHRPISASTPHKTIRFFMEKSKCERCDESLIWEFGFGKTPHLHHDHKTGEIYGFTHPKCNVFAMEREISRLRKQIRKFKLRVKG